MLCGKEIIRQVETGGIVIRPFNPAQINPNSYNMMLGDEITVYTEAILDPKKKNVTKTFKIGPEGYVITPGQLYLASTQEYTESETFVPILSGRSSTGRVGLTVHLNSGFGEIGYKGHWMLGLTCTIPVRVFPGMKVAQMSFTPIV